MKLYKNLKQKWIVISNHEMLNNYFNLANFILFYTKYKNYWNKSNYSLTALLKY